MQVKIDKYLLNLYDSCIFKRNNEIESCEEKLEKIKNKIFDNSYPEKLINMAEDVVMSNSMHCMFKGINSAVNFKSELALYPLIDKLLLIIYDGELAADLLQNKDFCERYEFSEYGYWNNVDKPENVSDQEWDQRKRDWENIDNIPAKNCICFSFGYDDTLSFPCLYISENKEKLKKLLKENGPKRLKEEIFDCAFDNWCNDHEIKAVKTSDVFKFDGLYRKKDNEIVKYIENATKEVEKKFGWIREDIINSKIKDFI